MLRRCKSIYSKCNMHILLFTQGIMSSIVADQ